MFVRAYLRASTDEQDATRARDELVAFAAEHGQKIAAFYVENVSGAKLERSGLARLLADSHPGDVLLIEGVDRLSRLDEKQWEELKGRINAHGLRIVSMDLPTSHMMLGTPKPDDFTARLFAAINAMLLDVTAAVSRKDYLDRRRRQEQGQARAKAEGRYKGRPEDVKRNAAISGMLGRGMSWSAIIDATGCSRATVAKVAKRSTAA
ncbi:recombinase family protein [Methylobacterium sp. ARG-1]|uniref:recombinase family protein n=1 Tax=Methylobacterium sp. ARG-1 TaxID=1692501 RepID=UPI000681CFC8|nr:recombinase family protein [Methylobacterium sp. ARG-1]KNY21070.1 resolvase [Methylobacterium sp. ARG-1]